MAYETYQKTSNSTNNQRNAASNNDNIQCWSTYAVDEGICDGDNLIVLTKI